MTITLDQAIADRCLGALERVTVEFQAPVNFAEMSPTQRMFALAIDGMSRSPLAGLDEEAITASLAARMATQYTWAVECSGLTSDKPALWGQYSKNGQGDDSESRRGADFALVVPVDSQFVKIAIFQAKKARGSIVDLKRPGSTTAPELQMDKLIQTAFSINAMVGGNVEDLTWIHYVFWRSLGELPKSIPLAALGSNPYREYKVDVSRHPGSGSFADLLLGATVVGGIEDEDVSASVLNGWLQLTMLDAEACLPALLEITDVVFVDDTGGGQELATILREASDNEVVEEFVSSVNPISLDRFVPSRNDLSSPSGP